MKTFIGLLVAMTALASVNCDSEPDMKTWIKKTIDEYKNLSVSEIGTRMATSALAFGALLKEAGEEAVKKDLVVVAQFLAEVGSFFMTEGPKSLAALMKVDQKYRKDILVEFGFDVELMKLMAEKEKNNRKNHPLKVTDTEDNYKKKFKDVSDKMLAIYRTGIEMYGKDKGKAFLADYTQTEYNFFVKCLKNIDLNLKTIKSSEERAENLLELVSDLNVLVNIATNGSNIKGLL